MITAECLAEQSTRGPRYTSYPPATEMGSITPATIAGELAAVCADGPASLYLHIPFCKSLCWYCGCNVIPTRDVSRGEAYADTLVTELALYADQLGPKFPLAEIALGGGSPNFLRPETMRRLIRAIDHYFDTSSIVRRSIELDPRESDPVQLEVLGELGFRAMSVGVQDFATPVQDAIHRHQSREQTSALIAQARAIGFRDINIDIVYGLPRQTEASFADTLSAVIDIAPDRIALFGYAHLPDKLPHQKLVELRGRVLDRYERATLLLAGIEQLTAAGYIHLGLDHFVRPGSPLARALVEHRVVRTFQGYVEHVADTILGAGTSAISSTQRAFWQNTPDLASWERSIIARRLPVVRGLVLDEDDRIRRTLIDELMCFGAVDLRELDREYAIDSCEYFASELASLDPSLARFDPRTRCITTTGIGRLLVRNLCMAFDGYLTTAGGTKFSSTI